MNIQTLLIYRPRGQERFHRRILNIDSDLSAETQRDFHIMLARNMYRIADTYHLEATANKL